MRSAFAKDIFRTIRTTLGRFVAIAGIVALGCGFYAGLRMTAPDMRSAADTYYDRYDLMDIRVISTLGMTEGDIEALSSVDGVDRVAGAYETDAMVSLDDERYAMRIHSLPEPLPIGGPSREPQVDTSSPHPINGLSLVEGALPATESECVISVDNVMRTPVSIGDTITVEEGIGDLDETLAVREFTIVGFVHSPLYVATTAMGSTSLGSGKIEQFMYVSPSAFEEGLPFTEAYVQVVGAIDLMAGGFDYQSRVDEVIKEIEGIASDRERIRFEEIRSEARSELDGERADFEREREKTEEKLSDAKNKLDEALSTIESSKERLASGRSSYDSGQAELDSQRAAAAVKLSDARETLASQRETLGQMREKLDALRLQFDQLDPADPAQAQQYEMLKNAYDQGEAQYAEGLVRLEEAQGALEQQEREGSQQLAQAQQRLDAAAAELERGEARLSEAQREYASGLAEYEENREKADEGFAEAEQDLADAQRRIDDIPMPEWLIMDRTKIPGAVSFDSDAERVDSIASFFPFIFFLVAALVALTTMTRMVEEERTHIGTLKALGYSRGRITSKYLIYGAIASLVGSILGVIVLSLVLPPVIMNAYGIIYSVPHTFPMPIDLPIAGISIALGVGITLFSTWAAVRSTLRETPALLMLPRAPKEGRRILLERIGPLWRRLSFSWKVTCRNIFRYKKRLIMTVIGIAGCTGLLLTGLGLDDAINDIIDKQFGRTVLFNVEVTGEDDLGESARDELRTLVEEGGFAQVEPMKAVNAKGSNVSVSLIVPEDPDGFRDLWVMRERIGGEALSLDQDGVIISEKLATLMGVSVGDTLALAEQDAMGNATSAVHEVAVTGIMENYIANYAFMSSALYVETFDESPQYQTLFARVGESERDHAAFRADATKVEGVKTVSFNDETIDTYRTMLKSVGMIVVVLVIAAGALAFIVLYNLTNINITERIREIATLKVLGFTRHEVDMYVYRETIILTILGGALGLVFGIFLEGFVVTTAEVDYVMFGRDIHIESFIVAFVLTILFSVIVMVFMRGKLARIDMIESLKSVE